MKKSFLRRMAVLAVVLCLATTSLMSGTLAKYTTTVAGSGSATVAKWSFKANGETATMAAVALTDTTLNNKVADRKIAPGTDGSFDITIDASGSEVAVDYTIAFSDIKNQPENLKFYSDESFLNEITNLASATDLNGTIALADINTAVKKTVYWKWEYGADANDNADQGKAMSFNITVTGTQQNSAGA